MKLPHLIPPALALALSLALPLNPAAAAPPALLPAATVPYSPTVITDKKNNEWFIEQNGGLQRNTASPSLIGNCMMMQFGSQQFYSQQPMMTPDGREIVMSTPQSMNGLSITRRITVMDKEGGLRYVDEFINTTSRDLTMNVEMRHGFNGQAKGFMTETGRATKDSLEAGESCIIATPGTGESEAPLLLFTLRSPGAAVPVRLAMRNTYQLSVFYTLVIPAGQTVSLVHAIAQLRVGSKAKTEEIAKACRPFLMPNLVKGLPKATVKGAANMTQSSGGFGLAAWTPDEYWGVRPEVSDILALDAVSRLKGRAAADRAALAGAWGRAEVPWSGIAALAGTGYTHSPQGWLWLDDGQRWLGALETPGLRFTLISGADLDVANLGRLILARPAEATPLTHALLETWSGERIAFVPTGSFDCDTPWGRLKVAWADVLALEAADEGALGALLHLQDGTRLRVLPVPATVTLATKSFGDRPFDLSTLRQAITPRAASAAQEDSEPGASFLELAGDQRLVGRVTAAALRLVTQTGPFAIAPSGIRELRDAGEDPSPAPGARPFQADLWGGGTVVGSLETPSLRVEGRGYAWDVPVRHLLRLVNPVAVTDSALMRRIGQLIQELGDPQWKTREAATSALREMGPLAKSSLQEALKASTDAEVTRRLEELLAETE